MCKAKPEMPEIVLLMDFPKNVINFTEWKETKFPDSMSSALLDNCFILGQAWQLTVDFTN